MSFIKTTEQASNFNQLEKMTINELLKNSSSKDKTIPYTIEKVIPIIEKMKVGTAQKLILNMISISNTMI